MQEGGLFCETPLPVLSNTPEGSEADRCHLPEILS